jgi:hypothetical protein
MTPDASAHMYGRKNGGKSALLTAPMSNPVSDGAP